MADGEDKLERLSAMYQAFLKKGGVFSDELIDAYLAVHRAEERVFAKTPHPVEFKMYYSL